MGSSVAASTDGEWRNTEYLERADHAITHARSAPGRAIGLRRLGDLSRLPSCAWEGFQLSLLSR